MVSFEHPGFIIFLVSVIVLILAYSLYKVWLKRNVSRLGSPRNVRKQLIGISFSNHSRRMILISISLFLMVFALMNIRKGSGTEISDRKGLDIIVALDVSKSMLARDLNPNRLDRSKVLIQQLMQKLNSDRVGFIIFAGNAYLQSPITSDYNAVRMMLETATPDAVPTQGTVLGEAIELARKSFNQETNKYKVILLISDGEDHDESALNMAEKAKKEGVVIYTVGVGSPQGAYIIEPATGQPKKDEKGEEILSRLNEKELKDIAAAGDGNYFFLNNPGQVAQAITDRINQLEKRNQGTVVFTQYKSYYQWFLGLALIGLLIEGVLSGKRPTNGKQ